MVGRDAAIPTGVREGRVGGYSPLSRCFWRLLYQVSVSVVCWILVGRLRFCFGGRCFLPFPFFWLHFRQMIWMFSNESFPPRL